MNFAAVLKPKAPVAEEVATPRYEKKGWVNLRDWKPEPKKAPQEQDSDARLDARLKAAAVALRRRWDQWNADHGIEYDYDRECSCSDRTSDNDDDGSEDGDGAAHEDGDFDKDYQYIKKTTLVTH